MWNVSHCLTNFSRLWVLVFKLSSHTQCQFACPQNCQKWLSVLPSNSVYGLLSPNPSVKENEWFPIPPSSSVIFNSSSACCHLKKRSWHYHVLQDSRETILEEEERGNSVLFLFHCCRLQTLNASSNRVAKDGVKRTENVPIGKASTDFSGTRIWPMPRSIPSLGFGWVGSSQILWWGRQHLQMMWLSRVSAMIILLAPGWIFTCRADRSPTLGITWKEGCVQVLAGLSFNTCILFFVCPFPHISVDSLCLLLKSDEGLSHKCWHKDCLLTPSESSPVWEL